MSTRNSCQIKFAGRVSKLSWTCTTNTLNLIRLIWTMKIAITEKILMNACIIIMAHFHERLITKTSWFFANEMGFVITLTIQFKGFVKTALKCFSLISIKTLVGKVSSALEAWTRNISPKSHIHLELSCVYCIVDFRAGFSVLEIGTFSEPFFNWHAVFIAVKPIYHKVIRTVFKNWRITCMIFIETVGLIWSVHAIKNSITNSISEKNLRFSIARTKLLIQL